MKMACRESNRHDGAAHGAGQPAVEEAELAAPVKEAGARVQRHVVPVPNATTIQPDAVISLDQSNILGRRCIVVAKWVKV